MTGADMAHMVQHMVCKMLVVGIAPNKHDLGGGYWNL